MLTIRLGHDLSTLRPGLTNGPGWRIALWTQGCTLLCTKHCLNPHLLSTSGGYAYSTETVADAIVNVAREYSPARAEGVTVLGGEPTDQAEAVASILEYARLSGLSTMVYSGYTLEELRSSQRPGVRRLLDATDVLVDGPFKEELYSETLMWRGSSNQRIHCLTGRYDPDRLQAAYDGQRKGFSLLIDPSGDRTVSGLQVRRNGGTRTRIANSSMNLDAQNDGV